MSASVRMRQKKVSHSRFMKDVVSWLRKFAAFRREKSIEAPGPSVPGRVRSVAPDVDLESSGSDENEVSLLPEGRVALDSLRFRHNLKICGNGDWRRTVVFFREENIIVLEARFTMDAVLLRRKVSAGALLDPF